MKEQGEIRKFEPKEQDYLAAALGRTDVDLSGEIPESTIASFCKGCDQLQEDGICLFGSNDQARYAGRQWCGWASVNKVRGQMTSNGFEGGE